MNGMIKDIMVGVVGCLAIIIGGVGKRYFYAKSLQAAIPSEKPMRPWLGRALFFTFGVAALLFSITRLIVDIK